MAQYEKEIKALFELLIEKGYLVNDLGLAGGHRSVKYTDLFYLENLQERLPCSIHEGAVCLGMERNQYNTWLAKMVKLHFLRKEIDPSDRRKTLLWIGQDGTRVIENFQQEKDTIMDGVLSGLTVNEEKAILKFLSKINQLTVKKYELE